MEGLESRQCLHVSVIMVTHGEYRRRHGVVVLLFSLFVTTVRVSVGGGSGDLVRITGKLSLVFRESRARIGHSHVRGEIFAKLLAQVVFHEVGSRTSLISSNAVN